MGISSFTLVLLCSLLAICNAKSVAFNRCYAKTKNPYLLMGSRTAYEVGRGENTLTRLPPESNCKAVQIWAFLRHGARYPGGKDIRNFLALRELRDQILENHEKKGRGRLCKEDLDLLRKWDLNESEMKPNSLTPGGAKEHYAIGERLRAAFPDFFNPEKISQRDFLFKTEYNNLTYTSMEALMEGALGSKDAVKPVIANSNNSIVAHPRSYCRPWMESKSSDKIHEQSDKFMLYPEFQDLIKDISQRLGFSERLDIATLDVIYEVCRHEKAWNVDKPSAWCSAFSDDNVRMLEYREDMGCYYMAGPGRRINRMIGCSPVKDMVEHFRNLEDEEKSKDEPKAIFYFAHTVNLAATLYVLGIGEHDLPPLASNYHLQENRTFRLAHHGPFAGNIIAIFYKCDDAKTPHRVAVHVTEKLHRLDGCDDDACDFEAIKRKYNDVVDHCSVDYCFK